MAGDEDYSANVEKTAKSHRRKLDKAYKDIKQTYDQAVLAKTDPSAINLFKGMYVPLQNIFETYESVYDELCDLIDANGDPITTQADEDQRALARLYLCECNGVYPEITSKPQPGNSSNNTTCCSGRSKPRLPHLDVLKFHGDRTKWPRWKDTFTSMVINDNTLEDIDRFHYLVRALVGNAAAVIAHVPVAEDHFRTAWDALVQAYDNKRLLASTYLDKLLDIKQLPSKATTEQLSQTVAQISETVAAFKTVAITDRADFMLFHLARRALDTNIREDFERENKTPFPTVDELITFLRSRCIASELATGISCPTNAHDLKRSSNNINSSKKPFRPSGSRGNFIGHARQPPSPSPSTSGSTRTRTPCVVCHEYHPLGNCLKFANATVSERLNFLKNWRGCRNCLALGHSADKCPSSYRCRFCRGKHHSQLHVSPASPAPAVQSPAEHPTEPKPSGAVLNIISPQPDVLFATALCHIWDPNGRPHRIRLVIDSCSTFTLITHSFASRIGLPIRKDIVRMWGIGETPLGLSKGRTTCTVTPIDDDSSTLTTSALVLDAIIPPLPGFDSPPEIWDAYHSYTLADPDFWVTQPIDLLLGCELFPDLFTGHNLKLADYMPRLMSTIFGYVAVGRVREVASASRLQALHISASPKMDELHEDLKRFWELEEPPTVLVQDPEDVKCEELFQATHERMLDGRYVVRLPFREANPHVASSRGMALRRLEHLETKLARNPKVKDKYHEFMREYLSLGHMELAKQPGKYIIPHHCVVKTLPNDDIKLRVVFDAAARTATGSLNDLLLVGPKLQPSLVIILLCFRIHPIVFTADAVKMFRQILVHPEDRVYQHILWRFDPSNAVSEYELNTVSYGQAPAPYLALRTLKQLVADEGHEYPLAATALSEDTYIDDIATGASSLKQALELLYQLIALMDKGGFSLSKWASNHPAILDACRKADPTGTLSQEESVSLEASSDENSIKILGMRWDPKSDLFSYSFSVPRDVCTKRAVLSAVAKIYDPLGYLGPTVVTAKILVQEAWKRGLDWDDEFPLDIKEQWTRFLDQLPHLGEIKIPRWIVPVEGPFTILIFADASEKAYCAAAYLRSVTSAGVQMHLIMAKTKLAPVKFTSIPRLELCAALLAARVWESLDPFIKKLSPLPKAYFFSDSTIVLSWLLTPFHRLQTFIANRVVKIRALTTTGTWHHVASLDNPSDLGSRGVPAAELVTSTFWFHGPKWALSDSAEWPLHIISPMRDLPELKSLPTPDNSILVITTTVIESADVQWMAQFSSLPKLLRCICYMLRLVDAVMKRPRPNTDRILVSEIRRATIYAVKLVQRSYYFNNCDPSVVKKVDIPKNLMSLSPFFNEAGVLLVGGRLKNLDAYWDSLHPILLPAKAHYTKLVLQYYHKAHLHPGSSLLLAIIRSKYWIVGARRAAREISKDCVKCRRFDAPNCQPIMGNLPAIRFCADGPFLNVGVDFAGPFTVRESSRRKAVTSKVYLCLFVCLSTKALHLELVSSLSTAAFIAAFNRFIGRRGKPSRVFSDNGTNFVGAAHLLKEFYAWYAQETTKNEIIAHALIQEVEWTFIPPHAPAFGGVWEAGVKSVKRLMRNIYSDSIFNYEELSTLFIEIESILNSRPLCPMSSDPNDLAVLTPGHFLIGRQLTTVPRPSLLDVKENRLTRWELVEKKMQHFWKRWRCEYVSGLQERLKWRTSQANLKVGDLVLLREDNVPNKHWPVGRIIQVFPGNDGIIRVVNIRTASSSKPFRRPVHKLTLLLPPDNDEPSPADLFDLQT